MTETTHSGPDIRLRTYRLARTQLGAKELDWSLPPDSTVGDLLEELGEEFDVDPGEFLVMVNRRNIKQLEGERTRLENNDVVTLSIGSLPE